MNDEAVPAAKPAEAYGRLRDAFERIVRRPADYGEVDALRSLIVGAGYIPPLSAKAEPVQIDREALLSHAERVSGALEEYEFEGIAAEAPAVMNALIDALAAQPVTGTVEWEYGVEYSPGNAEPESEDAAFRRVAFIREGTGRYSDTARVVKRARAGDWQEVTDE